MNYFSRLLMTHILIKQKYHKEYFFFIYAFLFMQCKRYVNRYMKKKTRNAFKIVLVLKMLSNEEERYLKKYGQILNNLPILVVHIS